MARHRFVPQMLNLEDRVTPSISNTISIADSIVTEPAAGHTANMVFTLTRTGDLSSQVTVSYTTINGTAHAGSDYTPPPANSGTATFSQGSASTTITVPVLNDNDATNLNFSVQLTGIVSDVGGTNTFSTGGIGPQTAGAFAESKPIFVTVADINGDGKPDIVVANEYEGSISVLLNSTTSGSSTLSFMTAQTFGGMQLSDLDESHPFAVVAANFSGHAAGDNRLDLAVLNQFNDDEDDDPIDPDDVAVDGNVVFLRNTTSGNAVSFVQDQTVNVGVLPTGLAVGTFNGKPDVVVTNKGTLADNNSGNVQVLFNNTDFSNHILSFSVNQTISTGEFSNPTSAAVGDVDNANGPDIVTADSGTNSVSVLLNSGFGSFGAAQNFLVGNNPQSVALADVNNDGHLDAIVANAGSNNVSVLVNTGTASLFPTNNPFTLTTGAFPVSVAAFDLNGDGKPDLMVANYTGESISILRNTTTSPANVSFVADPTIGSPTYTGTGPNSVAVGDFNLDGHPDLAIANIGTRNFFDDSQDPVGYGTTVTALLANPPILPVFSRSTATGTIDVRPLVAFSVASESLDEDSEAFSITITMTNPLPNDVTVPFTLGGNAMYNVDYTGVTNGASSGTVTITAGTTSAVIKGTTKDDGSNLPFDKTLTFTLGAPTTNNADLDPTKSPTNTLTIFEPQGTPLYAVGADAGGGPRVQVYDATTGKLKFDFFAYAQSFTGGVRVATGDLTGDGVQDIVTAAGTGGGPHVKVFDGVTGQLVASFFVYDPSFTGGVYVAVGDVNGDGKADIIVGAGAGPSQRVKIIDGTKLNDVQANGEIADSALIQSFYAYSQNFTGGVRVAAGDVNADGLADVITGPGPGGGPEVRVFNAGNPTNLLYDFWAFDPTDTGGINVAAGDLYGDFHADIIASQGQAFNPLVRIFSGATSGLTDSFTPFTGPGLGGPRGVTIATAELELASGNRKMDLIIGTGPESDPNSQAEVDSYQGTSLVTGTTPELMNHFNPFLAFNDGVFVG